MALVLGLFAFLISDCFNNCLWDSAIILVDCYVPKLLLFDYIVESFTLAKLRITPFETFEFMWPYVKLL